jgi:Kef-type K+ transport system membrane component KefB
MEISPEATGKILGMVMAYGVSSLGLLLAYYNYRKRIVKAEKIFTTAARIIISVIVIIGVVGAITVGAVAGEVSVSGIIVPVLIFAFSFLVTWFLYRHFTRKMEKEP